jgi:ABC-type sugar transport system permease subunit
MWRGIFDADAGAVNRLFGISVPWLISKWPARFTTIGVMVAISFPYFMVVSFGFVKSIPRDYFEAGALEGASAFYMFRKITLRILFGAMKPVLIMSFLMQFNQFGVYLLTEGGPVTGLNKPGATDLLLTHVFNLAFKTQNYGLAAAYATIIFVFMGIFAMFSLRFGTGGFKRRKKIKEGKTE